jgi:hypothetical protein
VILLLVVVQFYLANILTIVSDPNYGVGGLAMDMVNTLNPLSFWDPK